MKRRLAQVVEDELGLEDAAELVGRSVEAILRPMAYQTLECDRRGGLAARERREELSDPVPVLCDPIEVTRNLLAYKFARFLALPFFQGRHDRCQGPLALL